MFREKIDVAFFFLKRYYRRLRNEIIALHNVISIPCVFQFRSGNWFAMELSLVKRLIKRF